MTNSNIDTYMPLIKKYSQLVKVTNSEKVLVNICECANNIFKKKTKKSTYSDILLNTFIKKYKQEFDIVHKIKVIQMRIGQLWQCIISSYPHWDDLFVGDKSGLDLINKKDKFIVELKNAYNTDNSSSRKRNYEKLKVYIDKHKKYQALYAIINERNEDGYDKMIDYEDIQIRYLSGNKLMKFIFGDDSDHIIKFLQELIELLI